MRASGDAEAAAILWATLGAVGPQQLVSRRVTIDSAASAVGGQSPPGPEPAGSSDPTPEVCAGRESPHGAAADESRCLLAVDGRPLAAWPRHGRLVIVGAGKAAAGLARGLAARVEACPTRIPVEGLLSVPEGCGEGVVDVAGGGCIEIRATRPAGSNLPTPSVVAVTGEMCSRLARLGPDDLAVALVTGGGSACLAAPRPGLSLDEKIAVTRFLSAAGADIRALNVVRQAASVVKGGGLARACRAGRLVVLVLSDIIGDPLDLIASAPCLPVPPRAAAALDILGRFGAVAAGVAPTLVHLLEEDARDRPGMPGVAGDASVVGAVGLTAAAASAASAPASWTTPHGCRVDHVVLGSNATAVEAAAARARELGYDVTVRHAAATTVESADDVGIRLARDGLRLLETTRHDGRPRAIVEGGEAVMRLPAHHGRGGRNQHTVVAALAEVLRAADAWPAGLVVASIGTDGEDGPTTAAGGSMDAAVAARVARARLDVQASLARCDTHTMLDAADGLVVTGPTGTNVADVRLVLARP